MEATIKESVSYQVQERVAIVTLDAPERGNALAIPMMNRICELLQTAQCDPNVTVVELRAKGKHFCTGADLGWAGADRDEELWKAGNAALNAMLQMLFEFSKPLGVRVQGSVIGGGVAMLCLCDDVVAVTEAPWYLPELRLGMVPSAILPALRLVATPSVVRRVLFDDTPWNSADAHRFGIVTRLASSETLEAQVQARLDAWKALPADCSAATKFWMRRLAAEYFRACSETGGVYARAVKPSIAFGTQD